MANSLNSLKTFILVGSLLYFNGLDKLSSNLCAMENDNTLNEMVHLLPSEIQALIYSELIQPDSLVKMFTITFSLQNIASHNFIKEKFRNVYQQAKVQAGLSKEYPLDLEAIADFAIIPDFDLPERKFKELNYLDLISQCIGVKFYFHANHELVEILRTKNLQSHEFHKLSRKEFRHFILSLLVELYGYLGFDDPFMRLKDILDSYVHPKYLADFNAISKDKVNNNEKLIWIENAAVMRQFINIAVKFVDPHEHLKVTWKFYLHNSWQNARQAIVMFYKKVHLLDESPQKEIYLKHIVPISYAIAEYEVKKYFYNTMFHNLPDLQLNFYSVFIDNNLSLKKLIAENLLPHRDTKQFALIILDLINRYELAGNTLIDDKTANNCIIQ